MDGCTSEYVLLIIHSTTTLREEVRTVKGKEAEVLADAVKKENMRLEAYRNRDECVDYFPSSLISFFHSDNSPTAPPIDIVNNVHGIDWSIVAEKVSDRSSIKRTPDECRIQWVGNLHPRVNHGIWTVDELEKLHHLTQNQQAQEGGKIDWVRVARDLGVCHAIYRSSHLFLTSLPSQTNRIPIDCMKQAIVKPRHHWDALNDQRLMEAVQLFGTNNWNLGSSQLCQSCMHKQIT